MLLLFSFFFFNPPAPTQIYTLSLHDALPISDHGHQARHGDGERHQERRPPCRDGDVVGDRKSTRLNSSHTVISYAVFCLKKKKIGIDHEQLHDHTLHSRAYSINLIDALMIES